MRRSRKILAAMLSVCVLCSSLLVSIPVLAAEPWDGTADTSWYTDDTDTYSISTAKELAGLAELVNAGNDFTGITVNLTADIDLNDVEWVPIGAGDIDWSDGSVTNMWNGIFKGNGHTIAGFFTSEVATTSNDPSYTFSVHGLFGFTDMESEIHGITVEGSIRIELGTTSEGNVGGIVGYNTGLVSDCVNRADIVGQFATGGIAGFNTEDGHITRCINEGDVTTISTSNVRIGGITGITEDGGTVSYCANFGTVAANGGAQYVGGIVGAASHMPSMSYCFNAGTVKSDYSNAYIGGLVGGLYGNSTASFCFNVGDIVVSYDDSNTKSGALFGEASSTVQYDDVYYLDSSYIRPIGLETVNGLDMTADAMRDDAFLAMLNNNGDKWGFAAGFDYPTFLFTIAANYSDVQDAIDEIPADLDLRTPESRAKLQTALDAVQYGLMADRQADVDAFAAAIRAAIGALDYLGADYSKVDDAIAQIPDDLDDKYTAETVQALRDAVNAVDRSKNITQQDDVDAYAQAILDAIDGLVEKTAGGDGDKNGGGTPNTGYAFGFGALGLFAASLTAAMLMKKRREQ